MPESDDMLIIDDFAGAGPVSALGTPWRGFSDRVMGGISQETLKRTEIDGRRCLRLTGDVRLENNGGFIQMALDLSSDGAAFDAAAYTGVAITAYGNGETYGLHLRTPDCLRPWQSYRAPFVAEPRWRDVRLPFDRFAPHRVAARLELRRLRRLGLVAIGGGFHADLAIGRIGFYR